jgi:two-component system sensor histidine kinase KdpD
MGRRQLAASARGTALGLVLVAALSAAMLPLRDHLSVATSALVLVVPVVASVSAGGFAAGVISAATGFLLYDLLFIPPYYTLEVGAGQNWVALGVYAVVTIVVARVVSQLNAAKSEAQARAEELRRLFDVSELLVRDASTVDVLQTVVASVVQAFAVDGATLLLPDDGRLEPAASAGAPLTERERNRFSRARVPVSLEEASFDGVALQAVPLSASRGPIGLLVLRWPGGLPRQTELLRAFANHLALALERARLRDQALRASLLEEVDRLRRALVGAVSHDLRTPLATIKVAATTLLDSGSAVSPADAKELLGLIDNQADRLDRLVTNLLDMTRIQSGALELRRQVVDLEGVVIDALSSLGLSTTDARVRWEPDGGLPAVDVDPVLIRQVLANLVDNGLRYSPEGTPVVVRATPEGAGTIVVSVTDRGPGVPRKLVGDAFQMFNQRPAGGRGGLGLAIAAAFVQAHGQRVWVDEAYSGGARFLLTLPAVDR